MDNILTRNPRKKIICGIICAIVYIGLQALSMTIFKDVYTFGWLADHLYCYTWISAAVLIVLDKRRLAYCVIFGNLSGTLIGEVMGLFIMDWRMNGITAGMKADEIEYRSTHYGVLIWLAVLVLFIAAGTPAEIINSKNAKKS